MHHVCKVKIQQGSILDLIQSKLKLIKHITYNEQIPNLCESLEHSPRNKKNTLVLIPNNKSFLRNEQKQID